MNATTASPQNIRPSSRPAAAIARDVSGASNALVDLAARIAAGLPVATDLDALAVGLQRCATELRMGGGDGRA